MYYIYKVFLFNGFVFTSPQSMSLERSGGRKREMHISGTIRPIRDQCLRWQTDKNGGGPVRRVSINRGSRVRGWHTANLIFRVHDCSSMIGSLVVESSCQRKSREVSFANDLPRCPWDGHLTFPYPRDPRKAKSLSTFSLRNLWTSEQDR